jgi:hypothetical protein
MKQSYDFTHVRRALVEELNKGETVAVEHLSIVRAAGDCGKRAAEQYAERLASVLRCTVKPDGQHFIFQRVSPSTS